MADLTTPLGTIVERMSEQDWSHRYVVAWTHEGDGVICVKPAVGTGEELIEVEDLVLFLSGYGFHLGHAPGTGAADPQYQFKRLE